MTFKYTDEQVTELHEKILTLDSHCDTPLRIYEAVLDSDGIHDLAKLDEIDNSGRLDIGLVDFHRMVKGGLDAVFFIVFIDQGPRTVKGNKEAKRTALALFDIIHHLLKNNSDRARIAVTPDDAGRIKSDKKRSVYIGIENGYAIGRDISMLKKYYDLGARYLTLCHMTNNDLCDSCTDKKEHDGLSDLGRKAVFELNRLGMMVDISHASRKTVLDVLDISEAPVIASHSSTKAICSHDRNLDDQLIIRIAEKGGIIQVCLLHVFLKRDDQGQDDVTLSDYIDHIDRIVKITGIDHVGIGSDFDGGGGIHGCSDVSEMKNITAELIARNYPIEDIEKIWSKNFFRVFRQVEKIAGKTDNA